MTSEKEGVTVQLLDHAFYMPQLDRLRRIWLCLPEGYASSGISYPVIYMQDGQNLFDELNAFGSEWGVDETLDAACQPRAQSSSAAVPQMRQSSGIVELGFPT